MRRILLVLGVLASSVVAVAASPVSATPPSPPADPVTSVGVLSLPREVTGAVAVWDPVQQVAYVFGGLWEPDDERSMATDSGQVVRYDPVSGTSTVVADNTLIARHDAAAVWNPVTGKAYIFGGSSGSALRRDIVAFTPGTATALPVIAAAGTLPDTTRSGLTAAWDSGAGVARLFFDDGPAGPLGNPGFLTYRPTPPAVVFTPLQWDGGLIKSRSFGAVVIESGIAWYFGGALGSGPPELPTDQVLRIDLSTARVKASPTTLTAPLSRLGAASGGPSTVLLVGGFNGTTADAVQVFHTHPADGTGSLEARTNVFGHGIASPATVAVPSGAGGCTAACALVLGGQQGDYEALRSVWRVTAGGAQPLGAELEAGHCCGGGVATRDQGISFGNHRHGAINGSVEVYPRRPDSGFADLPPRILSGASIGPRGPVVFGGRVPTVTGYGVTDEILRYNRRTSTWVPVPSPPDPSDPTDPDPSNPDNLLGTPPVSTYGGDHGTRGVEGIASVFVPTPHDGCLIGCHYLFGGNDGGGGLVKTIARLDELTGKFEVLPVQLPLAIAYSQAVFVHDDPHCIVTGCVYLIAGLNSNQITRFNPATQAVANVGPIPAALGSTVTSLGYHAAVYDGQRIVVMGGMTITTWPEQTVRDDIWFFDPHTDATWASSRHLTTRRYGLSASCDSGHAYAIGGATPFGDVPAYTWPTYDRGDIEQLTVSHSGVPAAYGITKMLPEVPTDPLGLQGYDPTSKVFSITLQPCSAESLF